MDGPSYISMAEHYRLTVPFLMRLPPETKERLRKVAAKQHRSMGNLAAALLIDYLEREDAQAAPTRMPVVLG